MDLSTRDEVKDERDGRRSLVQNATDTLLFPLRVATSPPLLRTYLRTFLLVLASTILFAFAVVAYTSFYYSYIPVRGISIPVYLQFDHGTTPASFLGDSSRKFGLEVQKWPHGVAGVKGLVNRQKYDVLVEMVVPRSRTNLRAGNWMVELSLRGPSTSATGGIKGMLGWDDDTAAESALPDNTAAAMSKPPILAHSRRPAILTYRSWPTEHIYRLLRLPLYLSGFGTESETLHVSMLESAYFPTAVPSSLRLELRSRTPLEVYRASVHISAKLEGLRWIMYTYKLSSLIVFVALFWGTEMGVLLLTWGVATMLFGSSTKHEEQQEGHSRVKKETRDGDQARDAGTEYSDTDRTFPTLHGQQPLRYLSPDNKTKLKDEPRDQRLEDIPTRDEEADDEDDDFVLEEPVPRGLESQGAFTDSGLGTGMDSERDRERERVRRRGSVRGGVRIKDERDL
ncbi:uncharacterized protein EKO05_0005061 [Ascochyta rabiei]|nr:uncharacterized protein EKO05_0005061 [Ascochyta rabiei]UPX14583.1 hypothetical protein EKO05_0005061 [Ascochyta rabiei]